MSADNEAGRRLRRAYREAWAARPAAGDGDEVLRDRLRAHRLSEVLDETTEAHRFVFDLWRRRVPPRRLWLEVLKLAGRATSDLVSTARSLQQAFSSADADDDAADRQADLEELPEGKEGVLGNVHRPASVSLVFEPGDDAEPLLSSYAAPSGRGGGRLEAGVWLDMHPDEPRASVLLGSTVIGETVVPVDIWRTMSDLADEDLHSDGFLELRVRDDTVEVVGLVCYHPR